MNPQDKVTIQKLPTGVPGLDEIVGGGMMRSGAAVFGLWHQGQIRAAMEISFRKDEHFIICEA